MAIQALGTCTEKIKQEGIFYYITKRKVESIQEVNYKIN
jgi:hypothetical protein